MKHALPNAGAPLVLPLAIDVGSDALVATDEHAGCVAWADGFALSVVDLTTGVERRSPWQQVEGRGKWHDYDSPDPKGQLVFRGEQISLHDRDGKLWRWAPNSDAPPRSCSRTHQASPCCPGTAARCCIWMARSCAGST